MSTNFPTALDALTNPTPTDYLNSPSHAGQHANANDSIEALEAKVGIDGSAVTTSHSYKIASLETFLSEVTGVDKAVGKTATQTLTNKTIDTPIITGGIKGWDEWIPTSESVSYSAVQTITVSSALAALLQKGAKIKLTNNSTVKYFYVVSVSGTTVVLTGEVDLANSAITSVYYSYADCPFGFKRAEDWYKCSLTLTANQTITDASSTKLDFEKSDDPNSNWSDANNEYTVPISGYYAVNASAIRAGTAAWTRAFLNVSGASIGRGTDINSTNVPAISMNTIVKLTKGDTISITLFADVSSGSPEVSSLSYGAIQFMGL